MFDAQIYFYSFGSVLLVSLISLIGLFTFSVKEESLKKILLFFVSFSAGALFGDAFIHLLPEAAESGISIGISLSVLGGIMLFFILEKFIHWRHCHIPTSSRHPHPLAVMNLVGDGAHNFIDGLVIGASYLVSVPVGVATTIAVILHEIPQEIGDFGVLLHAGLSKKRAMFFNFLSAIAAVVGTMVALICGSGEIAIMIIPFAAGGFIYIAGSDLIPELHKETNPKKSAAQLAAFLAGVGIMLLLLLAE
ncbi:MAG: ZIP family metal transporter [Nanoarchaeota archaeon]|nr:ZIP family metal transporter [Nanoarchaeota archaeon]